MKLQTVAREQARPSRRPRDLDARALEAELRRRVRGEVRFDDGSRALYSTASSNYRQVPIGVVVPRTVQDVIEAVAAARELGAPITMRGGGTSLAGQCCNVAVVIDSSKYLNRILDVDFAGRRARVQPGVVLDHLRNQAEKQHLTFAPDPSTHNHCTLGGMIGNNSCGVHSVMGGKTEENVEEMDILLYDGTRLTVGATSEEELGRIIAAGGRRGEIYRRLRDLRDRYEGQIRARFPDIPRRVSGYNLPQLLPEHGFNVARALVGTEGTCAVVLEAVVRLVHSPPARSLLVLGYDDVYHAADHIPEVMAANPIGCEGIDDVLVEDMKRMKIHPENTELLPEGKGWLLVEFGGDTKAESDARAHDLLARLKLSTGSSRVRLFDDDEEARKLWKVRESGLGATARLPDGKETWEGWEDSAVPPEKLGSYLRKLRKLFDDHGYQCALYGHFGQGCVHTRIDFDLKTREGIARYRRFITDAAHLVVEHGGSLSGEHGDGQSKAEFLPLMFGEDLVHAFNEFKSIFDPDWKMNPGKVVKPYRIDENLRLGANYRPPALRTHFAYAGDQFSFAKASTRCVGIGECRKQENGTMCPSYMVTLEETHSTRGRAHLLFEMLQGDPLRGGWRSEPVREALDLCLACKGCKSECPVNVDMATYKAEFLSHYYAGRLRPRQAYAMGLIHWWARIASRVPRLANFLSHGPGLSRALKRLGGIAPERNVPELALRTFRSWFRRHAPRNPAGPRVLLWADTFNNFFHPEVAQAAVEVLEDAGYHVLIQPERLCCGRPLYDYGMLDLAKQKLRQILRDLRQEISLGTPIVGLEPSCVATFRDELTGLFPNDEDAKRLERQTWMFSEFLMERARSWQPPLLARKAVVQGHCHHKAVVGFDSEQRLMRKMGLEVEVLDSGCCGMAGSFGFEAEKYEISMKVGERRLLPRVRQVDGSTLVVADGFSCREQIAAGAGREPLHLAQVLQLAMRERHRESRPPAVRATRAGARPALLGLAFGSVAVLALFALARARR
jgi:FAD/FMN-containing dehydrogenase/Fe-S oxidoreductase